MDLTEYEHLIYKYLQNEATPAEKIILEKWVRESKENETIFRKAAAAWESSVIELQNKTEAQAQVIRFFEEQRRKRHRSLFRWIGGAAAAVVLLFIVSQLFQANFLINNKTITICSADAKKELTLPDGSTVWLNAHSTIQYPKKFNRSRKVTISGEALFDVTKNNERNFIVETENITVEVLGTRFLINDRKGLAETETVLESGEIDLTVNHSGEKLRMSPNQQIIYNRSDKTTSLRIVNATDYTSWRQESLLFENTSLKDVFVQLEKWYNVEVHCVDSRVLNTPISFTLDEEPLDEILNILKQVVSFEWTKDANNRIIVE